MTKGSKWLSTYRRVPGEVSGGAQRERNGLRKRSYFIPEVIVFGSTMEYG